MRWSVPSPRQLPAVAVYGLVPVVALLAALGVPAAERVLYESLYVCMAIAIVTATLQSCTVREQVLRVLRGCGVVFLELAVVAYAIQLTHARDAVRRPAGEDPIQDFRQFRQRHPSPPPPAPPGDGAMPLPALPAIPGEAERI